MRAWGACVCAYVRACAYVCAHASECVHAFVSVCACVCLCVRTYVLVCVMEVGRGVWMAEYSPSSVPADTAGAVGSRQPRFGRGFASRRQVRVCVAISIPTAPPDLSTT